MLKGIRVTGESKQLKDDVVHQAIEEAVTSSHPDYIENDNKTPGRFEQSVLSNTGRKEQQRGIYATISSQKHQLFDYHIIIFSKKPIYISNLKSLFSI